MRENVKEIIVLGIFFGMTVIEAIISNPLIIKPILGLLNIWGAFGAISIMRRRMLLGDEERE